MIIPLPANQGVGFTSFQQESFSGYDYRPAGRFHNYHFTSKNFTWPLQLKTPENLVIDGFSPNLNKFLHVGHLRNLAIANGLSKLFTFANSGGTSGSAQFVAFLGCSLGIKEGAETELNGWFDFLNYHPTIYRDTEVSEKHPISGTPGEGEYANCLVWQGTKNPVVLRRNDGRTTYAYHDLAFVKAVGPTHYLTGSEQFPHFDNLGLGPKHLQMGLVLDPNTGKKMKSRDGTALDATQALQLVMDQLKETPQPRHLAWNVLAWNLLRVGRSKDAAFAVDQWTQPEAPGLYITYTYARLVSALKGIDVPAIGSKEHTNLVFTDNDVTLLGNCSYFSHYMQKSVDQMDLSPLANYAHDLAKKLNSNYQKERICDGRPAFQFTIKQAIQTLKDCLECLGLFALQTV